MNDTQRQALVAGILVVFAVLTRVLFNTLHVYNFNAVMAAGLFAGAYLGRKRMGFIVPFAAMLATDAILGFYDWKLMLFVYAAFGVSILIGKFYAKDATLLRWIVSVLGGSFLFFVVTNGAVWMLSEGSIYPKTVAGLIQCYTMGLPFYKNTLLGDLTWSAVLFGSYELMRLKVQKRVAVVAQ